MTGLLTDKKKRQNNKDDLKTKGVDFRECFLNFPSTSKLLINTLLKVQEEK